MLATRIVTGLAIRLAATLVPRSARTISPLRSRLVLLVLRLPCYTLVLILGVLSNVLLLLVVYLRSLGWLAGNNCFSLCCDFPCLFLGFLHF
jgi:hypothetical protein